MTEYKYSKVAEFKARGGPIVEDKSHQVTRTRAGRYVVGSIARHKSAQRWMYSTIEWGAPLRLEGGKLQYQEKNVWMNFSALKGFKDAFKGSEQAIIADVETMYAAYKQPITDVLSKAERAQKIPPIWLFNDFGHLAIKYFKDLNNNLRQDKNEPFMSDFVHTIPSDEYYNRYGMMVQLPDSHGCIHIHPKDIDILVGYIRKGSVIEIHEYDDTNVQVSMTRSYGVPRYEAHFYPALGGKGTDQNGTMAVYEIIAVRK